MFLNITMIKIAQEDQEQSRLQLKSDIDKALAEWYSVDESLSSEDLSKRADALWDIYFRLSEQRDSSSWQLLSPMRSAIREMENLATTRSGRTIYDNTDVQSIKQVVQEYIQHGELSPSNLGSFISDIRTLLNEGIKVWDNYSSRYMRYPLEGQDKQEALNLLRYLENMVFSAEGIDKNRLSDPDKWVIIPVGTWKDQVSAQKTVDLEGVIEEYPIVTFTIDKSEGIFMNAELGDMSPEESRISSDFQKTELAKFLKDVIEVFPNDWNKTIVETGDEGDFADIISGKLSSMIRVYRMMSPLELDAWREEMVPTGKYFATTRANAQGTDFGNEGDREIFTFIANRSAFRGDWGGNLVSIVPMILNGNRLDPVEETLQNSNDIQSLLQQLPQSI